MKGQTQQTNWEPGYRARRPYRLTPAQREALRLFARVMQPWKHSTGPRTAEGKARSRMNAWKHGKRSARATASQRNRRAMLRLLLGIDKALRAAPPDAGRH